MAQVIGRAGYDAVRKTIEELQRADRELREAIRPDRPYDGAILARLTETVRQPALWLQGAEGECRTALVLDALTDDFVVFHDFHLRKRDGARLSANIDHIVVGPTGVFVIDSKNCANHVVDPAATSRLTKKHVGDVLHQALTVRDLMKGQQDDEIRAVFVEAVLVHVAQRAIVRQIEEHQVSVLPLRMLYRRVIARQPKLSPTQVAKIRRVLLQRRSLAPSLSGD